MAGGMSTSEAPDHRPGRKPVASRAPDRGPHTAVGICSVLVGEIGDEAQRRAISHAPMCGEQAAIGHGGITEARTFQSWRDLFVAEREQLPHQRETCIL